MMAALDTATSAEASLEAEAIEIRQAVAADNEGLLKLTRVTPMAGSISLRIDRDPDFFALPLARGETVVFVATHEERIIGCMSASTYMAYVDGELERVAHATDLKVHPEFSGKRLAVRLISALEDYVRSSGIDLSFSLIADGNSRVMVLSEGRHGTPVVVRLGRFLVDQVIPTPFPRRTSRYSVEEASRNDLPAIATMLDRRNREQNFAPPISVVDLASQANPAHFRKTFVVRDQGNLVATLTVEDTQYLRQNVLIGLPLYLRLALGILRIVALPVPGLRIPRMGEPLATLYVRFIACSAGYEEALRCLLAHARLEAFRGRFTFLSIGLHESDPLHAIVRGLPRVTFVSHAMATSLIQTRRVETLVDRVPYEDFSLV
jgi:GNAT superfamily N-acetyltransferase